MKELRSFDSLAAMLATLRSGCPSKAARSLGRAPSSIYRAIERLEKDVGSPLFLRSAAGWKPTDTGFEVAKLSERMEAEIAEAELSLLQRNHRFPTPLRVSASDSFATYLGPVLGAFSGRQNDVAIDLVVDNEVVDFVRRQADLAIRPDMRPGDGLVGQRAGKLAHALYGSVALLKRKGIPSSLADLAGHQFCLLTPALPHFTAARWWKTHDAIRGANISVIANTETSLASAIAGGAGIGVLPCFIGDNLEGVVRVPAIKVGDPVDIWLVTHPTLRKNPVVQTLMRVLATAIRKDAALFAGSRH